MPIDDDAPGMTFAPEAAPPSGVLLFPIRRPRSAIVLTIVVSILALLSVLRIRPDTSLEGLFPRGDRSALALSKVLKDFSVAEELLLLVSVPDTPAATQNGDRRPGPTELIAFAERFEKSVRADPEAMKLAEDVIYRPDSQIEDYFTKVVPPNGLFYLDDAQFAEAKRRLTKEGMAEQLRLDEAMMRLEIDLAESDVAFDVYLGLTDHVMICQMLVQYALGKDNEPIRPADIGAVIRRRVVVKDRAVQHWIETVLRMHVVAQQVIDFFA